MYEHDEEYDDLWRVSVRFHDGTRVTHRCHNLAMARGIARNESKRDQVVATVYNEWGDRVATYERGYEVWK